MITVTIDSREENTFGEKKIASDSLRLSLTNFYTSLLSLHIETRGLAWIIFSSHPNYHKNVIVLNPLKKFSIYPSVNSYK